MDGQSVRDVTIVSWTSYGTLDRFCHSGTRSHRTLGMVQRHHYDPIHPLFHEPIEWTRNLAVMSGASWNA